MGTAQKHFAYAHNIRNVMLCYTSDLKAGIMVGGVVYVKHML